jgi:hypothetical protein
VLAAKAAAVSIVQLVLKLNRIFGGIGIAASGNDAAALIGNGGEATQAAWSLWASSPSKPKLTPSRRTVSKIPSWEPMASIPSSRASRTPRLRHEAGPDRTGALKEAATAGKRQLLDVLLV